MGGTGQATIAAAYRSYVLALLDRDAAYDDDPEGDPPLTLADYRRALVTVLALDPSPLLIAGRWVTGTEATAFTAGQQAGLDSAVVAIGETWRPELLRRFDDDTSEHSADAGTAVDAAMAVPTSPGPMTLALAVHHGLLSSAAAPPSYGTPRPPAAPGHNSGRLLVVDGDGEVVGSFARSEFARAHGWAHMRVAEPLTRRPVWIEDLEQRESWRIDTGSCVHQRWAPVSSSTLGAGCSMGAAATIPPVDEDDTK
ncbi:hypothetical protein [Frankia sp. CcWB3]